MIADGSVPRRAFLRLFLGAAGLAATGLTAACAPAAPAAPTSAPASTAAPKPTAAPAAPSPVTSPAASPAASPSAAAAASPVASPAAVASPAVPAVVAGPATTIRSGSIFALVDSSEFLALERGYFQDAGITLDVQQFDTIVNMIPLLGTGQLDVAFDGASSAGFFNAFNRGIGIKMVANQGVAVGTHDVPYYALVVAKSLQDSGKITRMADLKGLPVNVLSKGSLAELNVAQALATDGLTLQDVQPQELGMPDSLAALKNGSIAGSFLLEPFITLGEQQGIVSVLLSLEKMAPGREITEIFYSEKFTQNTQAANNFMVAYLRGVRDYVKTFFGNGGDKATAVAQLVKHLPVKDPALYDKMGMPYVNPDGKINAADVKSQQDWYVSAGEVQQPIDVNQAIDNRFVDYAVGVLGTYKG